MLKPGDVIGGKYRVERLVGQGAMASVWLATQRPLDRTVAIKCIHSEREASPELITRFLREARNTAQVRHRYVVEVFDFGQTEAGEPYMVMEFLDGETLAERLATGPPLSVRSFIGLMGMCLSGLQAAHEAGIVHRDLKPENIFLVHDQDGSYPKLVDFGISTVTAPQTSLAAQGRLTQEGMIVGTPQYMSPEQVRAKALDGRTDIYSLGVILYEALTGQLPREAESVGELIIKIATEDPPTLAKVRPELGEQLASLVARAMKREPTERFDDALEMRWALDTLSFGPESLSTKLIPWAHERLEVPPVEAPSPSQTPARPTPPEPLAAATATSTDSLELSIGGRQSPRRRRLTLVGAGFALALVVALIGYLSLSGRQSSALVEPAAYGHPDSEPRLPNETIIVDESSPPPPPVEPAAPVEAPSDAPSPPVEPAPTATAPRAPALRRPSSSRPPAAKRPPTKRPAFRDPGY